MTDTSETIDLRVYLRPLRARWWIVVLIAVAAAAGTYEYFDRKPTSYEASTVLLLNSGTTGSADADRNAREQAVIIGTRGIARLVAEELGLPQQAGLPGSVFATPSEGTGFLGLNSSSSNPRSAVELVNAYARVYVRFSGQAGRREAKNARIAAERRLAQITPTPQNRISRLQLQETIQTLGVQENTSQSNAQQIEPAQVPRTIRENPKRNAIFALALGAVLGIGLAYLLERLDRRVKRLDEISELYGSPVLVAIPSAASAAKASRQELKLKPPLTEAIRTLRTTVQLRAAHSAGTNGAPLRTLLVTSAVSGEGKSTVARSLALAYYEAGLRVALVDADLRRPTLADSFGLDREPGLTDVLRGTALADALHVIWPQRGDAPPVAVASGSPKGRAVVSASAPSASPSGPAHPGGAERPAEAPAVGEPSADRPHGSGLSVLTSGQAAADPAALLAGGPIDRVLRDLQADHDVVIVDTSPLLPVSDAVRLLAAVDGVLVVSRIGVTTHHAAEQLTTLMHRVPDVEVLGVVANGVREQTSTGYGDA